MSQWGHDFRPDYIQLKSLRTKYPTVPIMALTATANNQVVEDAKRALGLRNPYMYKTSFNRPNLHYSVVKKDAKTVDNIAKYIGGRQNQSGVIYCLSKVSERRERALRKTSILAMKCAKWLLTTTHPLLT